MISKLLQQEVEREIGEGIEFSSMLSGGSINSVAKVKVKGEAFVLKWNKATLFSMFEVEEKGLHLLGMYSGELIIPKVIGLGKTASYSWLMIQYIPEHSHSSASFDAFGRALATMHRNTSAEYGLDHDNYIGSLPQKNDFQKKWIEFFRACRIEPQLSLAIDSGKLSQSISKQTERLYAKLDSIFPDEPASLLHGDLWSGNMFATHGGRTALIDPAVYYGHREMELAFTRLFGGFSPSFYSGYHEAWPVEPGFEDRIDLYNLYPLLVHVNLFGGGYIRQVEQILKPF